MKSQKKTKNVLTDYFEEESPEDAVERLKDYLKSPTAPVVMINNILTTAFDKKDGERKLCVELMAGLKEFIDVKAFEKAFDDIIPNIPDLSCDIPKLAEHTGYFLAEGVKAGFISMEFITPQKLQDSFITGLYAEGLLSQFFKILLQSEDVELLKTAFEPFADSLQNFLRDKNRDRFFSS